MWFLLALTVLGTGVRVVRGRAEPVVTPLDAAALEFQIKAVDSAVGARRSGKTRRPSGRPARAGAEGTPLRKVTPEAAAATLDISAVPQSRGGDSKDQRSSGKHSTAPRGAKLDLDLASKAEIEGLPWVGPALAERIVSNRETCGAFGSLDGLQRVPGIGAGTAERLSEHVTFSGTARPSSIVPSQCQRAPSGASERARKPRP